MRFSLPAWSRFLSFYVLSFADVGIVIARLEVDDGSMLAKAFWHGPCSPDNLCRKTSKQESRKRHEVEPCPAGEY